MNQRWMEPIRLAIEENIFEQRKWKHSRFTNKSQNFS